MGSPSLVNMAGPKQRPAGANDATAPASQLTQFRAAYGFELDAYQVAACRALEAGDSVLVAAPTGSGKTVVGEFAIRLALAEGRKCFYTTPIKALSNQKYGDLVKSLGSESVGLLTGDHSINGEAPVVVMTTEVLRNMLYADSATLDDLGYVVMDEVHYLADRFRGAVWEEVIIHLAEPVRLVSLSATVSNAEEFGDWLQAVRGQTSVIVEEHRPVPLWQHVLVRNRLYDLFVGDGVVNPELVRTARDQDRYDGVGDRRLARGGRRPRRHSHPHRPDVIERLDREGLLPAITFIFSRVGCEAAVEQCLRSGLRLTSPQERRTIRAFVDERCAEIPDEDLAVLGYDAWSEGLSRGIAAHHAGMLPTFKEVVEELFVRGLVRAVFATETLALGINMPARSVVLEKLTKWNGETHADVTPGEYTQLTGRAGRRGIDVEGHAVVVWQPGVDPAAVAGLASTRTYPLRSSFRPSYNMAVNLTGQVGRDRARAILESSFAQFQADRAVVGLARQVTRNEEGLEGYRAAMTCDRGDFAEYADMRRRLKDREAELARSTSALRRAEAVRSLEQLRAGDVIRIPAGRSAGLAVVLERVQAAGPGDGPRPYVLTQERQARRLSLTDFPYPVEAVEHLRIPKSFNPRDPRARRDLASALRARVPDPGKSRPKRPKAAGADDAQIAELRIAIRAHACHSCDQREDHARWAERYWRLRRETDQLRSRVDRRSNSIARQFDRVCDVLSVLGYLDDDQVTEAGHQLGRLYTELDLVAAECLRGDLWVSLDAAELAACVSSLVYESRQPDHAPTPRIPTDRSRRALQAMVVVWGELDALDREHQVDSLRDLDAGFAWATWRWASGATLETVLEEADLTAGDFVRWTKQVIDLLDQIGSAASPHLRATAAAATSAICRGVVSYSSVRQVPQ